MRANSFDAAPRSFDVAARKLPARRGIEIDEIARMAAMREIAACENSR
jgi:hypothetical protein